MDVRHYSHFSDLVKAIRRQYRLSQRAMAKALRVSPGYVGQWELRLSQPSPEVASKLCQVFDIQDAEYVQRLAYAERAPEWLRESIITYHGDPAAISLAPAERQLISAVRRLSEDDRTRLLERVEGWVDGFVMAQQPPPSPQVAAHTALVVDSNN